MSSRAPPTSTSWLMYDAPTVLALDDPSRELVLLSEAQR